MKTALHASLFLVALIGFEWAGYGQGSMTRFTGSAQSAIGRTKSLGASTNGFTISAQRDFDRSVALTFTAATRYWFQETVAPRDALVTGSRYENATLWAQATPANSGLFLAANVRSPGTADGLPNARRIENSPESPSYRFDAGVSLYDEGQLDVWIQSNIRFATVDPVP